MKAYFINLDRRPDRLEYMNEQFARLGVTVERVTAIDAQNPDVAAKAAFCPVGPNGQRMSAGAFACMQSHLEAWRRLVESGDSHAMVLEDDIILADGFADFLTDGWVPRDADFVRLETFGTRTHLDKRSGASIGSRTLVRLRSRHVGTGCYVLSAAAARMLPARMLSLGHPIDEALFNDISSLFNTLITYQMVPAPAVQGNLGIAEAGQQSWAQSSINERFAGVDPLSDRPESLVQRLTRRVTEELRAKRNRTRYDVVPFG